MTRRNSSFRFKLFDIKGYLTISLLLACKLCFSQLDSIKITSIELTGNKKTHANIILRELDVNKNDFVAVADTANICLINKNKIFNTNLFVTVNLFLTPIDAINYRLNIVLKERWYIFPIPIFELADRNFNEWWNQRNRDINRIEWGLRFKHDNFRGRNQKLKIVLQAGFTKKYEIFHELPYINKNKTLGMNYGISYSTNKSIAYNQKDNKLMYLNSENILRKRFFSEISFNYRQKFFATHNFGLSFHTYTISNEVLKNTSFYFVDKEKKQNFLRFSYSFNLNKTNINYYPTKGYKINGSITQNGIGIFKSLALTEVRISFSKYVEIKPKLFLAHRLTLKTSTPVYQPYNLQYGLGYGENLVRGFQPYVIDGQNFALNRNELKYCILTFTSKLKKMMPVKQFETVPYSVYLKLFTDIGYVGNQDYRINSTLANKIGSCIGLGLDIVSYYDAVIRFEYSLNSLKEFGFNMRFEKAI